MDPGTNGMNGHKEPSECTRCGKERFEDCKCHVPRRLVLCFDGTGNEFKADETDSNVVKIYELLNRDAPNQYHHYQREFLLLDPFGCD